MTAHWCMLLIGTLFVMCTACTAAGAQQPAWDASSSAALAPGRRRGVPPPSVGRACGQQEPWAVHHTTPVSAREH